MGARIEFSKLVKSTVAQRSAYRCSMPDCDRITVGPGATSNQVALTGVAAHIFSAREGGPRGFGGLNEEELKNIDNAIWVCADHGRLIDANRGISYPAQLLRSFKDLQEAKISREQGGGYAPFGWFQQLTIDESPVFAPLTTIRFGRVTVVVGENGSGKTALFEWLMALSDPSAVSRWQDHAEGDPRVKVSLTFHNPERQEARMQIRRDSSVAYFVGDREVQSRLEISCTILMNTVRDRSGI